MLSILVTIMRTRTSMRGCLTRFYSTMEIRSIVTINSLIFFMIKNLTMIQMLVKMTTDIIIFMTMMNILILTYKSWILHMNIINLTRVWCSLWNTSCILYTILYSLVTLIYLLAMLLVHELISLNMLILIHIISHALMLVL